MLPIAAHSSWEALLAKLKNGKFRGERIQDSLQTKKFKVILITDKHILYVNVKKAAVSWAIRTENILGILALGRNRWGAVIIRCKHHFNLPHWFCFSAGRIDVDWRHRITCSTREMFNTVFGRLRMLVESSLISAPMDVDRSGIFYFRGSALRMLIYILRFFVSPHFLPPPLPLPPLPTFFYRLTSEISDVALLTEAAGEMAPSVASDLTIFGRSTPKGAR